MASVYSGAGEGRYGSVTVKGQVEFGMQYNYKQGTLEIYVAQCRDLAAVDAKRNRSDPYVKVGSRSMSPTPKNETLSSEVICIETIDFVTSWLMMCDYTHPIKRSLEQNFPNIGFTHLFFYLQSFDLP